MNKNLVLVFNCGSSSVKFAIVNPKSQQTIVNGIIQNIGTKDGNLSWCQNDTKKTTPFPFITYENALSIISDKIKENQTLFPRLIAIGHRVVHGGEKFTKSVIINNAVLQAIHSCKKLAPLHNPANILGIEITTKIFPSIPQAAVFDTAFHQSIPEHAYLYAIPYELYTDLQIRKYGFHGTSHSFVAKQAAKILNKPLANCSLITAHLGNGCSVCAISQGKSIDTSMGLTPLEGLIMGTRSGDIDPSVYMYLLDNLSYDQEKINNLFNKKSGLLGISGVSHDMRDLEVSANNGENRAILAIDMFCYRLAKYIGSYAVPLGKIDALIFTGGIGENSPLIRAKTIKWLSFYNFQLDQDRNNNHGEKSNRYITQDQSAKALVIPTNEELMIAEDTINLVGDSE